MTQLTYSAARTAANRIHRHFAAHPIPGEGAAATLPDETTLAVLIDAVFWTSLRREETFTPRISLAFAAVRQVPHPVTFGSPLSLSPRDLTRLAAAVERPGIHLCVSSENDELRVWGISRQLPPLCLVIEIILPGLLVVKRSPPSESGKFLNVAVLQGDEIKIVDSVLDSGPRGSILDALLRPCMENGSELGVNVLLQLAVSIRAHGRGGLLLVVPADSQTWKESMVHPVSYEVSPPFPGLADLVRAERSRGSERGWEDAMARAVDGIAGLTAVDGATVITSDYDLLVFGAKIVRRKGAPQVSQVVITEPVEGSEPLAAEPTHLGGTRHFSAAQFVHDQRDAIAMVASQDGRFTVFGWSPDQDKVHAHRIEALLL